MSTRLISPQPVDRDPAFEFSSRDFDGVDHIEPLECRTQLLERGRDLPGTPQGFRSLTTNPVAPSDVFGP